MMTGYEQARSIVAALDGDDLAAADAVQLTLPETGVCSTSRKEDGCCGEPAPIPGRRPAAVRRRERGSTLAGYLCPGG